MRKQKNITKKDYYEPNYLWLLLLAMGNLLTSISCLTVAILNLI